MEIKIPFFPDAECTFMNCPSVGKIIVEYYIDLILTIVVQTANRKYSNKNK